MHINDELIAQVEETAALSRCLLSEGKTAQALIAVQELLSIDPEDINVCICASAQLIDVASILQDIALAEQGIGIIERVIAEFPNASEDLRIQFLYNLSNGYSVKYKYHREIGEAEEADQNLQRQKQLLQSILIRKEHIPVDLVPAVLANYANTLDHLSRTFEAIDHFLDCLRIEPDHSLARGNCAAAIRRVVYITDQHKLSNLHACWEFSSSAVANTAGVLKWAGPEAVNYLAESHRKLRLEINRCLEGGMATLESFAQHRQADHPRDPGPEWVEKLRHDRLLLTFNQLPLRSVHEALEDAFFDSLTYGLDDQAKSSSVDLIHLFNAIKEEFVIARYLYYQAKDQEETLVIHNSVTLYADPEGDAEFGLISGLLKTSFRCSVDLFDKIAVFLALYLDLGESTDRFNFNNVWFDKQNPKKKNLHPRIKLAMVENYPLLGLRDLQRDFFRQEYPGPIKSARNAAVHRWLRLSWLPIEKQSRNETSWNLEVFSGLTLFMLRQAKAAILSLAAAVNVEERRRKLADTASQRIVIPTPLPIRKPMSARAAEDLNDCELDFNDT